jgi:hypothetical protein
MYSKPARCMSLGSSRFRPSMTRGRSIRLRTLRHSNERYSGQSVRIRSACARSAAEYGESQYVRCPALSGRPFCRSGIAFGSCKRRVAPSANNASTTRRLGDSRVSSVPALNESPSTAMVLSCRTHRAFRKLSLVFGFRNTNRIFGASAPISWTIPRNTEGESSGSGRLPKLWRFRIHCEAGGLEWQVRRRRLYPNRMSRLWGYGPETLHLSYSRRLTARPAVLAKRTEPDRQTSRPTVDGPAAR